MLWSVPPSGGVLRQGEAGAKLAAISPTAISRARENYEDEMKRRCTCNTAQRTTNKQTIQQQQLLANNKNGIDVRQILNNQATQGKNAKTKTVAYKRENCYEY